MLDRAIVPGGRCGPGLLELDRQLVCGLGSALEISALSRARSRIARRSALCRSTRLARNATRGSSEVDGARSSASCACKPIASWSPVTRVPVPSRSAMLPIVLDLAHGPDRPAGARAPSASGWGLAPGHHPSGPRIASTHAGARRPGPGACDGVRAGLARRDRRRPRLLPHRLARTPRPVDDPIGRALVRPGRRRYGPVLPGDGGLVRGGRAGRRAPRPGPWPAVRRRGRARDDVRGPGPPGCHRLVAGVRRAGRAGEPGRVRCRHRHQLARPGPVPVIAGPGSQPAPRHVQRGCHGCAAGPRGDGGDRRRLAGADAGERRGRWHGRHRRRLTVSPGQLDPPDPDKLPTMPPMSRAAAGFGLPAGHGLGTGCYVASRSACRTGWCATWTCCR